MFMHELEPWKNRWGPEEFKAVIHRLTEMALVVLERRRLPGSTSWRIQENAVILTKPGAALMTWVSRNPDLSKSAS